MAVYDTRTDAPHETDHAATAAAVAVDVDVELRVPRGEMGDLPAGVADVLAGVDGAETVAVGELDAVRPGALDIYVDATARLTGDFGDRDGDELAARVADAFGIEAVHAVAVEYDPEDATHGYG